MEKQEMSIESICLWNDDSIAWIYDAFFSSLVVTSTQITNDIEVAYDIVQDFFTNLLEQQPLFANMSHLKAYFYNSVRNRSVSWVRHEKVINAHTEQIIHDMRYQLDSNDEDGFYTEEIYRQLFIAVDKLPERQRDVFLLAMQGKSNSAIAQELNISVETVKTLKKRGKQKLRDTISPQAMLLLSIICMEF